MGTPTQAKEESAWVVGTWTARIGTYLTPLTGQGLVPLGNVLVFDCVRVGHVDHRFLDLVSLAQPQVAEYPEGADAGLNERGDAGRKPWIQRVRNPWWMISARLCWISKLARWLPRILTVLCLAKMA